MSVSAELNSGTQPPEIEIDQEALEARFLELYKRDPWFPAVIAARAALRVFPLIGSQNNFDFWKIENSSDNSLAKGNLHPIQDDRCTFLMAIFLASSEVLAQSSLELSKRMFKEITDTVHGASHQHIVCFVAAATADAADAAYSEDAATYTFATDALRAALVAYPASIDSMFFDFEQANLGLSITELAALPLWQDTIPSDLEQIYLRQFIPAVQTLIKEIGVNSSQSAAALNSMLSQYEQLLAGHAEQLPPSIHRATTTLAAENGSSELDKLGRDKLVKGLAILLTHKDNNEHLTIGLLGHWGSGKTRVLQLLRQAIKNKTDKSCGFLFGEFNAWAYEHAKNPQAAMAHEVIKSLTTCQRTMECHPEDNWLTKKAQPFANLLIVTMWKLVIRSRLSFGFMVAKYPWRLLMLFMWPSLVLVLANYALSSGLGKDDITGWQKTSGICALVAALFSLWRIPKELRVLLAQPYTKELLSYIKLPDYAKQIGEISEMRQDIELMVNIRLGTERVQGHYGLGKVLPRRRLLFVVDDLDRCSPEGIVKTFEAIRLVLDLPQVIVVVAVDQRIALAALALHYEKLTKHHQLNDAKAIARDYLAKMIQLPIVVGDGDFTTLKGYMSHLWQDENEEQQDWQAWLADDSLNKNLVTRKEKQNGKYNQPTIEVIDRISEFLEDEYERESEQQLAEWVLDMPGKLTSLEPEVKIGLGDKQKAAFAHWAEQFELRNARQVKRLYNSYNLMRLVSEQEDVPIEMSDEKFAFGLLVTLLTIEFINCIEDNKQRSAMGRLLRGKVVSDRISDEHRLILHKAISIIDAAAQQRKQFAVLPQEKRFGAMLDYVGLFVLPAIDGFSADETHEQLI